ncbi:ABC transporter substrate-binding protein [Archaeoglobus neptunius]|uniref:ABC transporter substrate-binding protein n=1 Tax=Archaeoglobus neptunius TaxID=2798580 RepID=UPI0019277779|nr:ABC transporter substrate-binding protein [Archaeoglobus neptunius]
MIRARVCILVAVLTILSAAAVASAEEIKIGVLVDLSGPLTTYGTDIKNTLEIAKEDINAYFKSKDLPYTVNFYVEDTKVDPNIALQKIQDLYAKGINLVIGPMGSGEVSNIKSFVTSNKIIIVSPSSTALPSLIGVTKPEEKKYIFRFVGTDDLQTDAITAELKDMGVKAVVITYIGNAWGKGLYETIKPKLEKAGIEIKSHVEYPDPPPADFSPYIAEMENTVSDLLKTYKPSEIAIVAFSYEETATLLAQTKSDSPLLSVIWLGSDGTALSSKALDVCDKASRVGLYSTLFESKGKAFDELKAKYKEKGFGEEPYQYAMNAYDAAWVLALSYVKVVQENGKYDADIMAETIPKVTIDYSEGKYGVYPVTGTIKLNEWNDRASGDYAIYYVTKQCNWDKAGLWVFAENKIEWSHKPEAPAPPVTTTTQAAKRTPGFEAALAAVGLIAGAYLLRRR